MIANDSHVAIEEEQMVVSGCLGKEIADGRTAYILFATDILTAGKGSDALVGRDDSRIGRAVVGHKHLIADGCGFQQRQQLFHQCITAVVVGGYQYGECLDIGHLHRYFVGKDKKKY